MPAIKIDVENFHEVLLNITSVTQINDVSIQF